MVAMANAVSGFWKKSSTDANFFYFTLFAETTGRRRTARGSALLLRRACDAFDGERSEASPLFQQIARGGASKTRNDDAYHLLAQSLESRFEGNADTKTMEKALQSLSAAQPP